MGAAEPDRLFATWHELVEIESGSHDSSGLERMAAAMKHALGELGFGVEERGRAASGVPHLVAEREGDGSSRVLLLGHIDTVWPPGALDKNPFRRDGDLLYGPGVADMKGGLAVMLEAIRVADSTPDLRVVLTTDEELGSPTGREIVETAVEDCAASLVFEAGRAGGGLVDRRRGIAVFTLTTLGKTAHAGNDPENGVNAVDELAYQLLALAEMRDPDAGLYVMAGVIEGGTARQVVPDRASALIDVRGASRAGLDDVMEKIRALGDHPHLSGAKVVVEGGETRPPFETVRGSEELKAIIDSAAAAVGFTANFVAAGGGSDGNFTAARGAPTLDGFGPVGHRLCSWEETAEWSSAVTRVALVSRTLERMTTLD